MQKMGMLRNVLKSGYFTRVGLQNQGISSFLRDSPRAFCTAAEGATQHSSILESFYKPSPTTEKPQAKYDTAEKEANYLAKMREQPLEELKRIKEGDIINLQSLIFNKNRDYLVRYNDTQQVKAAQLAGKDIVLTFVPLHSDFLDERITTLYLRQSFSYLMRDKFYEIVLVPYETEEDILSSDSHKNLANQFEAIFSCVPWAAIPSSDITCREHLVRRFGICRRKWLPVSFVIDSNGKVSVSFFDKYGGLNYPFSEERIKFLKAQDDAAAKKLPLKTLLASPERDYVISNNGDKVLIDTLEGKVVGLYIYDEAFTPDWLTTCIKKAYEESAQMKNEFEVVLIYIHDPESTCDRTGEESFLNTFKTMPWLAIPFNDPKIIELKRFFGYPDEGDLHCGFREAPKFVIFGPHGEFIDPWGADVLSSIKHPAYPFTRERVAKSDTEKVKELKLEMLWDRNTLFRRKDGSKVGFPQLVGKRMILFFEGNDTCEREVEFLNKLKERYFDMKSTRDEFEVIYITNGKKEPHIADMPWLVSLASEMLPIDLSLYCCYCHHWLKTPYFGTHCLPGEWLKKSSILAFDCDGRVVRKSITLSFEDVDFPFNEGGMEAEVFYELNEFNGWGEQDFYYWGLLINSFYKNDNFMFLNRHPL